MKTTLKDKLDTLLGVNVPGHFHKSLKKQAKKLGLTLSDYVTAILINEMRTGAVKRDVEQRIATGNILWSMYPTEKEIYIGKDGREREKPIAPFADFLSHVCYYPHVPEHYNPNYKT